MENLRYYLAYNRGLQVFDVHAGSLRTVGTFFEDRTLEHLTGSKTKPEVVFAAVAFDGGYRTRDAGKTWEKVLSGDVRTFMIDPNDERVIYAGTGPVRLFRSEDEGTSWEPLDAMLDFPPDVKRKWNIPPPPYQAFAGEEPHVRDILVHPDDSRILFVLLEHGGVLLSRDRGKTWEDRSAGIDYLDMHAIRNYPGSKERYYVSSARGFYRSDDCGAHWHRAEHGMPWSDEPVYCYSHEFKILDGNPPRMVVCGARGSPGVWMFQNVDPRGHILLSDDGGDNWRVATRGLAKENPWAPWVLVSHPSEAKTLFCGMGDGARGYFVDTSLRGEGAFYVSRDAGESWEALMTGLPSVLTAWVSPP